MKILAFDTCLNKTYITLYNSGEFINKVITSNDKNYHSAYLISTIVEILKENGLTPSDLTHIVTDIGPGSFTGIRACVTVARMLAQQLNVKVVGVSSLEILSRILGENDLVALDARKNKAYLYDKEILGAVELEKVDEVVKNRRLITDDSLFERFSQHTSDIKSYQQADYQLGEILTQIAIEKIEQGEVLEWGSLKPLYIQPPPVY
ncbi:tRNA (adenosine(37)-N6)-threonylcarbamoyltransferase complex dimerization subunit type 1 TsaB [bacterium]|nr:tRNA (adenosine(37)-N6)-threonylcarbamoyltransferase complex dimerization subunit type 1 TsaB [bacterium]